MPLPRRRSATTGTSSAVKALTRSVYPANLPSATSTSVDQPGSGGLPGRPRTDRRTRRDPCGAPAGRRRGRRRSRGARDARGDRAPPRRDGGAVGRWCSRAPHRATPPEDARPSRARMSSRESRPSSSIGSHASDRRRRRHACEDLTVAENASWPCGASDDDDDVTRISGSSRAGFWLGRHLANAG